MFGRIWDSHGSLPKLKGIDMQVTVVSDIHINSYFSKEEKFLDLVSKLKTDVLVINGDLYDLYLGPPRLDIQKIFENNTSIGEVVYIRGNHDYNIKDYLDPSEHKNIRDSYEIADVLITHGHQYDHLTETEPSGNGSSKWIVVARQWVEESLHINVRLLLKKISFGLIDRLLLKAQEKAIAENPGKKVILGHTHVPLCEHPYYNTGCMTDEHFTYLIIEIEEGVSTISLVSN